jgi:hypothetical protein
MDNELVQREAVTTFAQTAQRFRTFIDQRPPLNLEQFVQRCVPLLAQLYMDALQLPDLDPCEDFDDNVFQRNQLPHQAAAISGLFGQYNFYNLVIDPFHDDDAAGTMISDDLDDIYRDVAEGLGYYDLGTDCAIREAVFTWKSLFQSHWGSHLTQALNALHTLMIDQFHLPKTAV